MKGPCRAATTANITLEGLQTVDGVSLADGDRVLVKNQTSQIANGIYVVDTGTWPRAKDFSRNRDVQKGTRVLVTDGSTYANSEWWVSSANPVVIGTSSIVFTQNMLSAVELAALEAEAEAHAAAAETAETNAETAEANAEAALAAVTGIADAVLDPQFATIAAAQAYSPATAPAYIRTAGYAAAGDLGGALYKEVGSEPSHEGKFSISLSGGGGTVWYELAEADPTPQMFGAVGDGSTDDTAAFVDLLAFSPQCYWPKPATSYIISTVSLPTKSRIRTDGFLTFIQQKVGVSVGTRVIVIAASNVKFALEGIRIKGNIATDTDEQNFAIFVRGAADIENIQIGDVLGEDIRGDVVYIGGLTTAKVRNVSVGAVVGNNVYRNGVSVTGGEGIRIESITGSAIGYFAFDAEPNGNSQVCDDIYVGHIRGAYVGNVGLLGQKAFRTGSVEFGTLDLDPAFSVNSTPGYSPRTAISGDAITLRNAENIKIGLLKARNFNRSVIFTTSNGGEYGVGSVHIGAVDIEDCILTDVTYRAIFYTSLIRSFRLDGGYIRGSSATHRLFFTSGVGVSDTDELLNAVEVNGVHTNLALGYGTHGARFNNLQVYPGAGRVMQTVRLASTANVTIATLANGDTIDGVVVATNNIILLKDQTAPAENGLYRVNAAGPATRYVPGGNEGSDFPGSYVYVLLGTANAKKYFQCTNSTDPTLGSTSITYSEDVPYDAYLLNSSRDVVLSGCKLTLGRAGLDCQNMTFIGCTVRTVHASVVWAQSTLADGALHTLISTTFNTVAYALGTYSRSYLRPMNMGGMYLWVDSTGDLRVETSVPTSDTDGTVVGTQT